MGVDSHDQDEQQKQVRDQGSHVQRTCAETATMAKVVAERRHQRLGRRASDDDAAGGCSRR